MKIIVVGAGHGGLVAAARLAKSGYDVTIIEKREKNQLGYDWEDRFTFDILLRLTENDSLPENSWHYRGDCDFVSPSYRKRVTINYNDDNRQKIMWRKAVINMLIEYAEKCNVKLVYGEAVDTPIIEKGKVVGVKNADREYCADLVIDAAGVFSSIRANLPDSFNIKKLPQRGDVFYAYRAYYNNTQPNIIPDVPFEIYLCHNKEQGLSWVNTESDIVDVLIGRIDPLSDDKIKEQLASFRGNHSNIGDDVVNGGIKCVIPVCRPLPVMVANGYAAVGDSAFMTTPMNGMGIDLSMLAGELLADTVIKHKGDVSIESLWEYNRDFHRLYGGVTAKNEGLKNSLLDMTGEGVDFLFENEIIQSSDLAGAGNNTKLSALLMKLVRGMKNPSYFFAVLNGLIKGGKVAGIYKKAPDTYDEQTVLQWQNKINTTALRVTRK